MSTKKKKKKTRMIWWCLSESGFVGFSLDKCWTGVFTGIFLRSIFHLSFRISLVRVSLLIAWFFVTCSLFGKTLTEGTPNVGPGPTCGRLTLNLQPNTLVLCLIFHRFLIKFPMLLYMTEVYYVANWWMYPTKDKAKTTDFREISVKEISSS